MGMALRVSFVDTPPSRAPTPPGEVVRHDDVVRLVVRGEVDLLLAGELRRALGGSAGTVPVGLVVDLRATTFIDSGGMAALLNGCRRATRAGLGYAVLVRDGAVRDALERCRLPLTLGCEDVEEAAMRRARR